MSDHNSPPKRQATPAATINSIESTVDIFATRIARKLKERDEQQTVSEKAAEKRHALMLEGMTTIRKALQETLRINLGDRFYLDLAIDDYEGWPRVQLNLLDSYAPDQIDYGLVVNASDRKELGTIAIKLRSGEYLAKVNLCNAEEFGKLSLLLKKAVREFLDIIAAYILNPVKPEDLIATQTKALQTDDEDIISDQLKEENMFTDEIPKQDNRVIDKDQRNLEHSQSEISDLDQLSFDVPDTPESAPKVEEEEDESFDPIPLPT